MYIYRSVNGTIANNTIHKKSYPPALEDSISYIQHPMLIHVILDNHNIKIS